jgi:hypothetical protein
MKLVGIGLLFILARLMVNDFQKGKYNRVSLVKSLPALKITSKFTVEMGDQLYILIRPFLPIK